MKRSLILISLSIILSGLFFSFLYVSESSEKIVVLSTKYGDIKIKLYNETPLHRDNFIKLVSEKFFDDLLFHRVISEFMIQGGDPDSRNAAPEVVLGNGGPGYNIPAEILPGIYHKKGALAAAREGDNINPKKESSGSQFYIVQGKVYTSQELDLFETKKNMSLKNQILGKIIMAPESENLRHKLDSVKKIGTQESLMNFIKELDPLAEKELVKMGKFVLSPEQRTLYTTVGGTPHLDGSYTVYGEVIEGMNVVDSIAAQKKDKNDRPVVDIRMKIK